jgi:F0F1-type ATP synthase delta subunit
VEQAQGLIHVEVVSAVPLPPALQDALRAKIASLLHKTVELTMTVDKEILGGLWLRIATRSPMQACATGWVAPRIVDQPYG